MVAIFCLSFLCCFAAEAKLFVKLSPSKVTGSKAVVKVEIKNGFEEKVESARAQLFLLDSEGKVVEQTSQWVIDTRSKGLAPDASATFNFVVRVERRLSEDVSPYLKFTGIVLEGGKVADLKAVEIITQASEANEAH